MDITQRQLSFLAFITAVLLVLFGFYCEYVVGCRPCLLCLIQRNVFIAIGVVFFLAFLHSYARPSVRAYGVVTLLISTIGMLASGRQLWLQHVPSNSPEMCVPGLGYLFREFQLIEALQMIITGSQDCGKIDWQFLHISMAGWAMIFFVLFFIGSIIMIRTRK